MLAVVERDGVALRRPFTVGRCMLSKLVELVEDALLLRRCAMPLAGVVMPCEWWVSTELTRSLASSKALCVLLRFEQ